MPTIHSHLEKLPSYVANAADVVVAGGALSLPWWREDLHAFAGTAGDLGIILGAVFLILRILHLISHWSLKPTDHL